MKTIDGLRSGVIDIQEDTEICGMASGLITVASGCRLRVSGMVSGSVILGDGAEIETPGMFSGTILRR